MSATRSPPQFEHLTRLDAHVETADLLPVARLLAYLTDKVTLQFIDDGLRVKALSDTSTAAFDATIPVEYDTDTEPVTFDVETDQFLSAVSLVGDPDSVKFQVHHDDPEVTVSAGSYLDYIDALEPDDSEPNDPHPEVEYATNAKIAAHELKSAVSTVFGSCDGAVYVTLADDTLRASVPGVEAVGTASLSETEGRSTYTRLSDELFGGICQRIHPDETLRISTREEYPFHIEAGHYALTVVPRQFPDEEYDPLEQEGLADA